MVNDREGKANVTDVIEVTERTAFYRENGILMNKVRDPNFPFAEIYDKLFAIAKPYLIEGMDGRTFATVVFCSALDLVTMAMATSPYTEEHTQEKDMEQFMEMIMTMISHMEQGIPSNMGLAAQGKSIFNAEIEVEVEKPKLDS
jgi:hypothetical protein